MANVKGMRAKKVRCVGKTKGGKRCHWMLVPPSKMCSLHKKMK